MSSLTGVPRSQRLLYYEFVAAGGSPAWSTPEGTVTLVKSVAFYNGGAAEAHANFIAFIGGSSAGLAVGHATIAPQASEMQECWLVLNPTEMVWATADVAGVVVWISGAVLLGANPFAPAELREPLVMGDELWRASSPAPLPASTRRRSR